MDVPFLSEIMRKCKKGKWEYEKEVDKYYEQARAKLRFNLNPRNDEEIDVLFHVALSTDVATCISKQTFNFILNVFFSIQVFFHNHSRITGMQGKREDIF